MTLKEQIQNDFIKAMKSGDKNAKSALSGLKSKITESEKLNKNVELNDEQVVAVLMNTIKQHTQSYEAFSAAGRDELAHKEYDEMLVLKRYMPSQLSTEKITSIVKPMIESFKGMGLPEKAVIGKTIGEFNKNYKGQADMKDLKEIVESLV